MPRTVFSGWPLWRQLLLALGVILVLVNLVATSIIKHVEESYLTNQVEKQSYNTISLLAATIIDAVIIEDRPILDTIVQQSIRHSENMFSITIHNEKEDILAQKIRSDNIQQPVLRDLHQVIEFEGETFGEILIQWDYAPLYTDVDHHIAEVRIYTSIMLLLLAALTVILVNWLAVTPIQKISQHLDRLSTGDQPERLIFRVNREMACLTNSANQLSEFMHQRDERECELLHTREQLQIAHDIALSSSRAKSGFLATMSHEIRTPMNAILGILDLLSDTPLSNKQEQLVKTGKNSSRLLLTVINDVLDFSKMDANKLTLEEHDFDLHRVLNSTAELIQSLVMEKGLQLSLSLSSDLPKLVRGDANRLQQILLNLINNAVKFTHKGSILVSASAETDLKGSVYLSCSVEDTGEGIPIESQALLFEEFTQVDQSYSRCHEGTGLGLAICKRLVTLMGGGILIVSAPKGWAVHLSLVLYWNMSMKVRILLEASTPLP